LYLFYIYYYHLSLETRNRIISKDAKVEEKKILAEKNTIKKKRIKDSKIKIKNHATQ